MASEYYLKVAFAFDSDTKKCAHDRLTGRGDCVKCMAEMLDDAHAAGYRAGVEAAAKVCLDVEDENYRLRNAELLSIAEMRIRALATKEPGDDK